MARENVKPPDNKERNLRYHTATTTCECQRKNSAEFWLFQLFYIFHEKMCIIWIEIVNIRQSDFQSHQRIPHRLFTYLVDISSELHFKLCVKIALIALKKLSTRQKLLHMIAPFQKSRKYSGITFPASFKSPHEPPQLFHLLHNFPFQLSCSFLMRVDRMCGRHGGSNIMETKDNVRGGGKLFQSCRIMKIPLTARAACAHTT